MQVLVSLPPLQFPTNASLEATNGNSSPRVPARHTGDPREVLNSWLRHPALETANNQSEPVDGKSTSPLSFYHSTFQINESK